MGLHPAREPGQKSSLGKWAAVNFAFHVQLGVSEIRNSKTTGRAGASCLHFAIGAKEQFAATLNPCRVEVQYLNRERTEKGAEKMAKSWERKAGESGPAYEAFCLYRNLPYCDNPTGRSLAKVGQKLGKSTTLMERWSTAHEWQERCREYDNEIQREELEARKVAVKAMQQEHIATARKMIEQARAALEKLEPEDMKPRNILDFLKVGMELERRALFELLADSEVQAEYEPDNISYNPMLQLVKSLEDARKERRAKGLDEAERTITVSIIDEDMDRLTPEEQKEYERLKEKAEVVVNCR